MNETPEEKAKRLGVPLIPRKPPIRPDGIVSVCGECGLELQRIMGYCCPRRNCPCGFAGISCF